MAQFEIKKKLESNLINKPKINLVIKLTFSIQYIDEKNQFNYKIGFKDLINLILTRSSLLVEIKSIKSLNLIQ